ncbi:MAG: hypothetical protein V3U27_11130, partial [Candidatus Tectomicrobia bacterium]
EVAAIMDAPPYNTPPAKWHKALDLVRAGKVQAHKDGHYTVQGSTRPYSIHGTCPCPQGQSDKSKWCKHLVAVELWKRVQIRLSPTNGQHAPQDPAPMLEPEVVDVGAEAPAP